MTQTEFEEQEKRLEKFKELQKKLLPYEKIMDSVNFKQTQENIDKYDKASWGPYPFFNLKVDGKKCIISGASHGGTVIEQIIIEDSVGDESIFNRVQALIRDIIQKDYDRLCKKIEKL